MINFLFVLLILSIVLPMALLRRASNKKKIFKKALTFNLITFFSTLAVLTVFMFTNAYANTASSEVQGMAFMAAALVTGLCTIGTGIATGQAASSALAALSENENLMGKALIFVALAEGIAIYGLLISFTILGRV